MSPKVSCIVCAYNEAPRISYILEFLSTYDRIDEVVIVNDGSTDLTADVAKEFVGRYPDKYKLVDKKQNEGKGQAVRNGIEIASGEVIILSDADITYINDRCFDVIIDNLSKTTRMVVLDTSYIRRFLFSITGMTRLWSGQRGMFRADLQSLDWQGSSGYAIESYLNDVYMSEGLGISYRYCFGADSVLQFEKLGRLEGFKYYNQINSQIFGNYSVPKLLWHRINSPIYAIRFSYFTQLPPRWRALLAPITLSVETVYALFLFSKSNCQYLLKFVTSPHALNEPKLRSAR